MNQICSYRVCQCEMSERKLEFPLGPPSHSQYTSIRLPPYPSIFCLVPGLSERLPTAPKGSFEQTIRSEPAQGTLHRVIHARRVERVERASVRHIRARMYRIIEDEQSHSLIVLLRVVGSILCKHPR